MQGSGDRGVIAALSAAISSPSRGFYPLIAWNVQPRLLVLSTVLYILTGI